MQNQNAAAHTTSPIHANSARRRWAALATLVLAVLLISIDNTVLFLAVPSLARSLEPTATQILWIGDSYSLVIAGFLVIMGNFADRIGRKKLLLIGASVFGLASVFAAFSQTPEMLILARVLLGVAGATLMPSTLALIRNIFSDPAERTRAIAIWAAAFGAGSVVGPLLGGFLLEHFWWGSVFLLNVPVMVIMIVGGLILLPESRDPNPGRFDLVSALLSLAAMVGLVYAIKHFARHGFDVEGLVALLVAVGAGYWFVRRQLASENPMLDVRLFKIPTFAGSLATNVIAVFALIGLFYFFSQYLQFLLEFTPLMAGVAELPAALAQLIMPAFIGGIAARFGHRVSISGGMFLGALALVALAWTVSLEPYWPTAVALGVLGFGLAAAMTLTNDVVISAVPADKAGSASAISETSFELGTALGIASLGAVVNALYAAFVQLPSGISDVSRETITESLSGAANHFGEPGVQAAATAAFLPAMQITLLISAALTALAGTVAAVFIRAAR